MQQFEFWLARPTGVGKVSSYTEKPKEFSYGEAHIGKGTGFNGRVYLDAEALVNAIARELSVAEGECQHIIVQAAPQ